MLLSKAEESLKQTEKIAGFTAIG